MDHGTLTLEPGGDFVEITVEDSGIGIGEEDKPKIFQPFMRLQSPLLAKVHGTGLGLYLTRKLAREVLKGNMSFTSENGRGSRFVMVIPADVEKNG
jgi:signal transduction histidine kinase